MKEYTKMQKIISILLKLIVILSAAAGTALSAYAGRDTFMGGRNVFMFFTIQSNIALALICLAGLVYVLRGSAGSRWYVIKYVATVSITLTGAVFCFVLAPTLKENAWNIQNILTHVVVPLAGIADFFVTGVHSSIRYRNVFWVILPPIVYAVYAGIGYVRGWEFIEGINYPYFFLNWGSKAGAFGFTDELPYMGCVWWILLLLVLLLLTGTLYLAILRGLKKMTIDR
ncbi:MAG: Pr6Pr family membrane protein [Oscillospiraceae bacterium]|nr:Pr6Pr family membrane protein [Oscillospiraceae bacterium]